MAARGRGRPKFEATAKQREQCKALAAVGMPQPVIATRFGITEKTLRRNFRAELDYGLAEANAQVGATLFQMASSGKNVAATIFWLKTRAGYREVERIEHSGPDGAPIDVRNLTDDQIARLLASQGAAGGADEPDGPPDPAPDRSDPPATGRTGEAPDHAVDLGAEGSTAG